MPAPDRHSDELLALVRERLTAGKLSEAEEACRRALTGETCDSDAHRLLGKILQAQDRLSEAVGAFEAATRADPDNGKAFRQLAIALAEQGRLEEALTADRRAIELRPGDAEALSLLARLKRFTEGDPDLDTIEAAAERVPGESPEAIPLSFALAKAYEDSGDYERAFAAMQRANGLQRAGFEYDVGADVRFLERIAAAFAPELFDRFAGTGSPSEVAVLMVGMPRSGTTLVEQVLASHPEAHGAGELPDLRELAAAVSLLTGSGLEFPEGTAELRPDAVHRLGNGYSERLTRFAPGATRVVDKNNWNFGRLGLARLIVPRARVIHCVRDPLDTCLSCYSLPGDVSFACDLEELGRYYRAYEALMEHWREVLPPGWMLEVRYERLVDDFEAEARRIVSFCGLEWDDGCLSFYDTDRPVRTASFTQVRTPVYRSSVARWRRYEPYILRLIAALEHDQSDAGATSQ